ncbi:hypothetical protein ACQP3F_30545, partial [Escherichia coli]
SREKAFELDFTVPEAVEQQRPDNLKAWCGTFRRKEGSLPSSSDSSALCGHVQRSHLLTCAHFISF